MLKIRGRLASVAGLCALMVLMLFAWLIPAVAAGGAAAPKVAQAAEGVNYGDPFENGDFVWNNNTQTYRVSGITIRVNYISVISSPGHSGPFPYPQCLTRAYELFQQNHDFGGNFAGWGVSKFNYGYVAMTGNSHGIVFKDDLPTTGWCCQTNNDTTLYNFERAARLILIDENSWWEGGVYHACFAMMVDNAHPESWDQATMGCDYVWADWVVNGDIELHKSSANPSITDGNACYSLEGAVYGVYSDESCTDEVATMTTDADGCAKAEDLTVGSYWVKEKTASSGYAVDSQAHYVSVTAGQTVRIDVEEAPQNDPAAILLSKADGDRNRGRSVTV